MRTAAARAIERILSSPEAFALLISRLEAKGWRIERNPGAGWPAPEEPPGTSARDR